MEDRELIQKIKTLEYIKPEANWVLFCHRELMNEMRRAAEAAYEPKLRIQGIRGIADFVNNVLASGFRLVPSKAILTSVVTLGMLGGVLFSFAQNALPGSFFYSLKMTSENAALWAVPGEGNRVLLHTKLAERRVIELNHMAMNAEYAEVNAATVLPVIEDFKNQVLATQANLEKLAREDKHNAVTKARLITQVTERYKTSLLESYATITDSTTRETLREAIAYTEEANLEALTVIASASDENQEFVNQLREEVLKKIVSLETIAKDLEDSNIRDQVALLLREAEKLLSSGTTQDLLQALEMVLNAGKLVVTD